MLLLIQNRTKQNRRKNSMTIQNVHEILNSEITHNTDSEETTVLEIDLSNLYDFGHTLVNAGTLAEWESALKGVISKISKVVYETSEFVDNSPNIETSYSDFLGTIETIRVSLGDDQFTDNLAWDILNFDNEDYTDGNSFERMFGANMPTVSAKYTNKSKAFELKITKTVDQFRDAFRSAEDMIRFFNEIETLVYNYLSFAKERLNFWCFITGVLGACNDREGTNILPAGTTNADFINVIKSVVRDLQNFTDKYKTAGFISATPKSKLSIAVNGKLYDEMKTALYDVRNPEFLNIPLENIKDMNYFQSPNNPDVMSAKVVNTAGTKTTLSNIVAIIYDKRAMATTYVKNRVAVVPVPNKEYNNYFYQFTGQYYNNLDYPIIVITKNGSTDLVNA